MAKELAYMIVPQHTLDRGLVGNVIEGADPGIPTQLDLVVARMFTPSKERMDALCKAELIESQRDFLERQPAGRRALFLGFYGEDARETVYGAVCRARGIRKFNTFNEQTGLVDPAVLVCGDFSDEGFVRSIQPWLAEPYDDSGIPEQEDVPNDKELSLVMLKHETMGKGLGNIGHALSILDQADQNLVGASIVKISEECARKFYKPLQALFVTRLIDGVAIKLVDALNEVFDFTIEPDVYMSITKLLAVPNANHQYQTIVDCLLGSSQDEHSRIYNPSKNLLVLFYQGEKAIDHIRERVGTPNIGKAQRGTLRHQLGVDYLRNGVHATDSPENYRREKNLIWRCMKLNLPEEVKPYIPKSPHIDGV